MMHVNDLGAVSDGLTDTAPVIHQAIGSIAPARGGVVRFGAGVYLVQNPILILAPDGERSASLLGEGSGATEIVARNPDKPVFTIGAGVGYHPVRHVRIDGLQVKYADPPARGVPMFGLRNVKHLTMRDCWLRYHRTAVKIGDNADGLAASCEDIHFDSVKMDPAGEDYHQGQGVGGGVLQIENVNGLWVSGCSISGVGSQVGLWFTSAGTTTIDTVTVSDTLVKDCLTGVRAGDGTASNVLMSNVYFDKCQSVGVHLETAPDRELLNWSFVNAWVNSNHFGYIVDGRQGRITRCRVTGGVIDQAPVRFAVPDGAADFQRYGI